jgi:hypothetical protein
MRNPRKEERLLREIQAAQLSAVARVRGLFVPESDPRYNPDAGRNWQECTTRTRAAIILSQGVLAAERARQQAIAPRVFGMILMQNRIEDPAEWERMAAETEGRAIEAIATPATEPKKETP